MNLKDISSIVSDNIDELVYVSDVKTYELYYLNNTTAKAFFGGDESLWMGKKCYEVLQGKEEPCEFCTNKLLNFDSFYSWEFYNPILDKYFLLKDKLIVINDNTARLEIATDITSQHKLSLELSERLYEQGIVNDCISILLSDESPKKSIVELLKIICSYYDADRSYIYDLSQDKEFFYNTYEWHIDTVPSLKADFNIMKSSTYQRWINDYHKKGESIIENIEDLDKFSEEYQRLKSTDIVSLITVPFKDNIGNITGFIGVDNPKNHTTNTKIFHSIAAFVVNFFIKNKLVSDLENLSFYDRLTGLLNRNSYMKALSQYNKTPPKNLGVLAVDISSFKKINDLYGIDYGDYILKTLAANLKTVFKENVYRVGGDEFVVLCENINEDAFENLVLNFEELSKNVNTELSIGFAWNDNSHNESPLTYTSGNTQEKFSQILLTQLLSEIKDNKFIIHLQPKFDLSTNAVCGAEALIRRLSSKGKIQPPTLFLPFYEKEGMISHIDFFVFEEICKFLASVKKEKGLDDFKISVNFSRNTLTSKNIATTLTNLAEKYGVSPKNFIIEITETATGISDDVLLSITNKLSNSGFSLSLDDFGAGYSNLSIISAADFDEIKIDKSIIDSFLENEKSEVITRWAINLCLDLKNVKSVAEGIETKEQAKALKELQCTIGQGYLFSKPIPLSDFKEKYLA